MNKNSRSIISFFVVLILLGIVFSLFNLPEKKAETVGIETLITQIDQGSVKQIEIRGSRLNVTLENGNKEIVRKESSESLSTLFKNYGVDPEKLKKVQVQVKDESGIVFFLGSLLPFLIPFILISIFIYFMMRQVQGANSKALMFGQSSAREFGKNRKDKVTFKDVAGVKEAKEELKEVVEFLVSPNKFKSLGAKIPKGVLLMGSPGTGKTLLAKAVAGEADVPFLSISGSEFVEMFVGVGASRVRDLFKKAKKNAPCIVFIDEIDAVGRQRGTGLGGSHDEREQTLNQILVEMDGFETNAGVIIMAATNRADVLDPALLRPGRFDRRVILDEPDISDREQILKVHSTQKPLSPEVDLRRVAERTPGFTGADLANLLNEAAILAARRNKKKVGQVDILESIEKVLLGPERRSHLLSEQEKKLTAYHEAGHALVAHSLPGAKLVHKVSIISRGRAAGYTLTLPEKDKKMHTKSEFLDEIAVMLAGHTVEKEIFGEVTTGASNDLKNATGLAKRLITQYGMSENLAPRTYGEREDLIFLGREITEQRDYSEKVAEMIDNEISSIINEAVVRVRALLKEKRVYLDKIVEELLKKETLEKEEFEAIFSQ